MLRIAKTENGLVRGIEAADPRITAFKGIPFAAPPVGENRWRKPLPAKNWEGVRECFRFAPISVQDTPGLGTDIYCREWHVDPEIEMGEDCLYLNVWTPAKSADEKLPVYVWFFGGGLQWGYPAEMEFDGERIARRGIVVVSVNYRLNVFGFLAHPELTRDQPDAPTNFGSLDQQAGLKWVKRNIAAFGGDPDCVTISGQSAGGGSVMSQLACEENKGLFNRAIIMSGMIKSPYMPGGIGTPNSLENAEKQGEEFVRFMGCSGIEEARKLDAKTVLRKYNEFVSNHPRMFTVQDNVFSKGEPYRMILEGRCVDAPIMAGNTADEFPSFIKADSPEEYSEKVRKIFGESAEEFLAQPEAEFKADGFSAKTAGIEQTAKALFAAKKRAGCKSPNFYYRFEPDIPGWDNPGTFHSVDLWFFFETLAKCWRPFVGRHYDLARQMTNYLCNFVKNGDPNGNDSDGNPLPEWKPFCDETPVEMRFTGDGAKPEVEKKSRFNEILREKILK